MPTLAQLDRNCKYCNWCKERASLRQRYYLRNMRRGRQKNEGLNEGYKLQLERGDDMDVPSHDTKLKQRTEVSINQNYEIKHDKNDKLHQLIDKIGKAVNISELMNGEVVSITQSSRRTSKETYKPKAFNEETLPKNVMSPELLELDKAFKKKGYELRIVGGAVRDSCFR